MALTAKKIENARLTALTTAIKDMVEQFAQRVKEATKPADLHDIITADSRLDLPDLPISVTHQVVTLNFVGAEVTADGFAFTVEQAVQHLIRLYRDKDDLGTLKNHRVTVESGYFGVTQLNPESNLYETTGSYKAIISISLNNPCG